MELLTLAFLILLNGVFSMSEIALVSSRKFRLEGAARKGDQGAKKALALADNPNTFLSTVQIGITLIGILTGIFSGEHITANITAFVNRIDLLEPYSHSISVALVVLIITYFSLVFGELIPKRIGLTFPERISSFVAVPMEFISKVAKPFIWLLAKSNDLVLGALGISGKREVAASEEEITSLVHQSSQIGEVQEIEHSIVKRVFALGDRKVKELMTHRLDLVWFDLNDGLETVRKKTEAKAHSVYPVARKELDKLVGVVHLKELFTSDFCNAPFDLGKHVKKPVFVPESLPVYDLLDQLKRRGVHSAIVVDEYGSIEGIISVYDVFDALIGDHMEQDLEENSFVRRDDNSWLVDGRFSYFELLNNLGLEEEEENFTTVAGLILHILNHIPVAGERVEWKGFELEIVDMDERRIDKVLITGMKNSENDGSDQ